MNLIGIHTLDDLLRVAEIRGEYWIDESGYAMYADGDIGDANHELLALERLLREVLSYFDIDEPEEINLDSALDTYFDQIYQHMEPDLSDEQKELWKNDRIAVIMDYLETKGMSYVKDAISAVYGKTDPREYALKHWGWKRVHGNNIETWTLTPEDMQNIVRGLDDSGELDEGEEGDLEELNIEVRSTGKFYQNVPLHVLETGNPAVLNSY